MLQIGSKSLKIASIWGGELHFSRSPAMVHFAKAYTPLGRFHRELREIMTNNCDNMNKTSVQNVFLKIVINLATHPKWRHPPARFSEIIKIKILPFSTM